MPTREKTWTVEWDRWRQSRYEVDSRGDAFALLASKQWHGYTGRLNSTDGGELTMGIERHRKRVKHIDLSGHAHFLTFSCYRRMQLLSKDRTRFWFLEALGKARVKHEFDLWAWVIMPEHVHLLIYPRKPHYKTSKILASVKKRVLARICG